MAAVDFAQTKLVRPGGVVRARWIGAIGETGRVHIRYFLWDPNIDKFKPVQTMARYCFEHCIVYLEEDYPDGCPECNKERVR